MLIAPVESILMSDTTEIDAGRPGRRLIESDRINVVVHAGYGIYGQELVVFVDRFEDVAFHSEPASRNYGWMF